VFQDVKIPRLLEVGVDSKHLLLHCITVLLTYFTIFILKKLITVILSTEFSFHHVLLCYICT